MQIQWETSIFEPVCFAGKTYIIKRDDLLLPIGGNKARKLFGLSQQDLSGIRRIISYGGSQSNAMLALAQFCQIRSLTFDYYTRPVPTWISKKPLGNLADALALGMHWHVTESGLPPADNQDDALLIPQGIAIPSAELGIKKLATDISDYCTTYLDEEPIIMLPSGTGTTALYLQQHLNYTVWTVPCIGDAATLRSFFKTTLPNATRYPKILEDHRYQKFRFGEPHVELLEIYQQLNTSTGVEFELLYDAKTWLHLIDWPCDKPIIYIHSGGVSGNASMLARYRRAGLISE